MLLYMITDASEKVMGCQDLIVTHPWRKRTTLMPTTTLLLFQKLMQLGSPIGDQAIQEAWL